MKTDNLKDKWDNLSDYSGAKRFANISIDQFLRNRAGSSYSKFKRTLIGDLVLKTVFGTIMILNAILYKDSIPILALMGCLFVLLIITSWVQISSLRTFERVSDPGQTAKENLSSMLLFFERKSLLPVISMAATQIFVFVPGLILYFHIAYGYVSPISLFSFFVFGTLNLIGIVSSLLINLSQINFHKKHLNVCLSDLNENTLIMVVENIERSRKQDLSIKILLGFTVIFGFVIILVLLKAIIT